MKTLAELKPQQFEMKLKNPLNQTELNASLFLVGEHSPQFIKAITRAFQLRLENNVTDMTDDQRADEMKEIIASCVVGWSNDEFFGGPFSPEAIRAILKDDAFMFIRLQVKGEMDKASNFFLASSIT